MLELLSQIIAQQQIWLLAAVILLVGISKAGFAGGLGVLATPLLLLQFEPKLALALLLPLLMVTDLFTIRRYWRQWDWQLLKPLWPGAVAGIGLGALFLGQLNNSSLRLVIGLMAAIFAVRSLWQLKVTAGPVLDGRIPAWLTHTLSLIAGSSSTLLHAGGPPITMYLSLAGLPASQFIASSALFFTLLNWLKVPVYMSSDLWQFDIVLTALILSPLCWLGTWCGAYIRSLLQEQTFKYLVQILLLCTGLRLIYQSF